MPGECLVNGDDHGKMLYIYCIIYIYLICYKVYSIINIIYKLNMDWMIIVVYIYIYMYVCICMYSVYRVYIYIYL